MKYTIETIEEKETVFEVIVPRNERGVRRETKKAKNDRLGNIKPIVRGAIIKEISDGVYVRKDIWKSEKRWKRETREALRREGKRICREV